MSETVGCCESTKPKQASILQPLNYLKKLIAKIGTTNLLILGVFALIAIVVPSYWLESVSFTVEALISISPYLLVSILIAAYLKSAGADKIIARVFSGHTISIIIAASLFGALSPFCSCGVIPLIAALLVSGVPLPPVMAFWLASPIMSPDMFVLTAGELGLEFAVAKTLSAIGIGLLGGFGTLALQKAGSFKNPLKQELASSCGCSTKSVLEGETKWRVWQEKDRREIFRSDFFKNLIFLSQWLIFAFALESLMVKYLPPGTVSQLMDPQSSIVIPIAAFIGVPAYLNGYAAIPVASGLIGSGFTPGAVLTFMTAGAMTSIPAAIAVFSLVKRGVFSWYIFLSLSGAMLMGFAYQLYL